MAKSLCKRKKMASHCRRRSAHQLLLLLGVTLDDRFDAIEEIQHAFEPEPVVDLAAALLVTRIRFSNRSEADLQGGRKVAIGAGVNLQQGRPFSPVTRVRLVELSAMRSKPRAGTNLAISNDTLAQYVLYWSWILEIARDKRGW